MKERLKWSWLWILGTAGIVVVANFVTNQHISWQTPESSYVHQK